MFVYRMIKKNQGRIDPSNKDLPHSWDVSLDWKTGSVTRPLLSSAKKIEVWNKILKLYDTKKHLVKSTELL